MAGQHTPSGLILAFQGSLQRGPPEEVTATHAWQVAVPRRLCLCWSIRLSRDECARWHAKPDLPRGSGQAGLLERARGEAAVAERGPRGGCQTAADAVCERVCE